MEKKQLLKPMRKTLSVPSKKQWGGTFIALYYVVGWILNEAFVFIIMANYLYCFIPFVFYFFIKLQGEYQDFNFPLYIL